MLYIEFQLETNTRGRVTFQHTQPFDPVVGLKKSEEELKKTGLLVEKIPQPTIHFGKNSVLYVNPQTGELWYEYVDIPTVVVDSLPYLREIVQKQNEALLDAHEAIACLTEEMLTLRSEIGIIKGGIST